MNKTVQIVTIPCNQPSYLLKVLTNDMHYKGRFKGAIEVHDSPWDTDTEFEAQQLLVLSDDEIQERDYALYSTKADNKYSNSTSLPILCNIIAIKENKDSPNGKIYIGNTGLATIYKDKLSKVIASYPQLEGTLPLSKETIQQWIDNGTPEKSIVGMNHWCKEGTSVSACERNCDCIDSQGNLILEFVPERKSAITVKKIVLTDEEIEEKVLEFKRNDLTISSNPDMMFGGGYGFRIGYKQALKDLGYEK